LSPRSIEVEERNDARSVKKYSCTECEIEAGSGHGGQNAHKCRRDSHVCLSLAARCSGQYCRPP